MKKNGFTLIELIVSISVIGLVTGLFLANYSSANRRTDLTMTAQKLVADIRLAQSYSLGLARYGTSDEPSVPEGGWGVNFDLLNNTNNQYKIFADENADAIISTGEATESEGAQIITLPTNIVIQSLVFGITPGYKANVTFLPPDPTTNINSGTTLASSTSVNIILKDAKTNSTKTVRVNFLGLVEVID